MLLRQPDPTTCGSCCAIRARMVLDGGYDAWVRAEVGGTKFREEALAAHRRTNRPVDAHGRLQLPWPLALGTSPWALARELSLVSGTRYVVRPVLSWRRDAAHRRIRDAVAHGHPVPVYIGDAMTARHVVLALPDPGADDALPVYDPASGRDVRVSRDSWTQARLGLSGWDRPWFLVLPAGLSPAARRTRA
ncbi:hypothetical protein [Nocardioides ungokensis]|uniref:hypothetical protein n=1 Tax=Nocardioides ungokensis TaxID=1643322 RepID=UPI0015DD57DB|nr:hypothetical protein [Nocardioides ungokensis]